LNVLQRAVIGPVMIQAPALASVTSYGEGL